MLFLYGLFLKILSKLKLGNLFYPLFKWFNHRFINNSLPTIKKSMSIISKNTLNKNIKNKTFYFRRKVANQNNYDIQIVIPAYNSEKYIRQCLNSILVQDTNYKYQIIVVNDGSTDDTSKILNNYVSNPIIKVINEKNYGSSVARDTGLQYVNSKYVMFVDSDDKLASGAIQNLLDKANDTHADVVLGGSYALYFNKSTNINGVTYNNCNDLTLKAGNDTDGGPCAKIFRSSLFDNVLFPAGYTFEDMMIFFLIYPRCKKISSIKSKVYCYRHNPFSVSHKFKFNDASVDSCLLLYSLIKSLPKYNIQIDQYVYNTFLDQVKTTCMRNIYIDTKIQKSIFVLICYLYNKYFKGFSTNIRPSIPLEKCLKKRNYIDYILFCIMK